MSDSLPLIKVLLLVRDARSTKASDRALLNALALRCNPAKNFVCWPSYERLAEDTGLDVVTLKRAAKRLEDAKLIRRIVRPNQSNRWFMNVALLQQQAAAVKEAKEAANRVDGNDDCPFEPVALDMGDQEGGVA